MKLLIISDLHLDENNNWEIIDSLIKNMLRRIKNKLCENEDLIAVVLGDIINCGGIGDIEHKFLEADIFIEKLKNTFINIKFIFIPGNHEIRDFKIDLFNDFCQRHSYKREFIFTSNESVFSTEEAGINLVFVDSNLTRNHDLDGKIDIKCLKSKMIDSKKNIIFMHHPPCDIPGADRNILNSTELIGTYSNFVFYGHQHGFSEVYDFLKQDTDIHAVGSLLVQSNSIKNQFLLLDLENGRINYAYRYEIGASQFVANLIFPKKDNINSDHKKFPKPLKQNTCLSRKFRRISSKSIDTNTEYSSILKYLGEGIDSILKNNNLVILTGDAGSGKSFELINIYWSFVGNEEYFPIWVQLKNLEADKLEEYINYCKNTIDRKTPMLIFDGLDEIKGCDINNFISCINSAVMGDVEIKVIISVRTNFNISIEGFAQYGILPIDEVGILLYAESQGILKPKLFLESLQKSACESIAGIPFYLVEITEIFRSTNELPKKTDLLSKIISKRFYANVKKYETTLLFGNGLADNEFKLLSSLSEIALYMQLRNEYLLGNCLYTEFWDMDVRNLLKYSGIIAKSETEQKIDWEFEHNIFREYLVAKHLSQKPFPDILSLITYDKKRSRLRSSWFNVVSCLLPLMNTDELINWLIKNEKEKLFDFETDKIDETTKNNIFISLMEDIKNKNIPIYTVFDENKFAKYYESKVSVEYLIDELKPTIDLSSFSFNNATTLLRNFDTFYGYESELQEILLAYCNRQDVPYYYITLSIQTLSNIFKSDLSGIVKEIYFIIKNDRRIYIISEMNKLIVRAKLVDEYIEYILGGLLIYSIRNSSDVGIFGFEDVLIQAKSAMSIEKILRFYCFSKLHYQLERDNKMFEITCEKAIQLYNSGYTNILFTMTDCFKEICGKFEHMKKNIIIKRFFVQTSTLSKALDIILSMDMKKDDMIFIIEYIMDESLAEILELKYLNSTIDSEMFKSYVIRFSKDSDMFKRFRNAVNQKEGIIIDMTKRIDWDKARKDGDIVYLNSLFDKNKFAELLREFCGFFKDDNIKCDELFEHDIYSNIPHEREDLQNLRSVMYHSGFKTEKASEFLNLIDSQWDLFSITEICKILESNKELELSNQHKKAVQNYFEHHIQNIDFEKPIEYEHEYYLVTRLIFLMQRFDFNCGDEKLIEMLMLSWQMFGSSTSGGCEVLDFIMQRIKDKVKIGNKIISNIAKKDLKGYQIHTHIFYCKENQLNDAVELAINVCKDHNNDTKLTENIAIDYLIATKGEDYVSSNIVPYASLDLLRYLANGKTKCIVAVIKKLEVENQKSQDKNLFLPELIKNNSRYGLTVFLEIINESKSLSGNFGDSTVRCISEVNDIALLDIIVELVLVCFSSDFKDADSFGLHYGISKAIENLIPIDTFKIKTVLSNLLMEYVDNGRLTTFCNMNLEVIDNRINIANDVPLTEKESKDYIKRLRTIV